MDFPRLTVFMDEIWNGQIIPTLCDYIAIPNKSPAFDPGWQAHGHMEKVVTLFTGWAKEKLTALPGATLEVVRLEGRTPLIFIEVPGASGDSERSAGPPGATIPRASGDPEHGAGPSGATIPGASGDPERSAGPPGATIPGATGDPEHGAGPSGATILMYGHLDKQPEMAGWADGLGPWQPVLKDGRLYGRGGADDGYAMFAALSALLALKDQNIAHARTVIVIEACEESGSPDLPFYIDHLSARIGAVDLVVCLDSGCGNYEQLWLTTSLRGMVIGKLTVRVLDEGVHSGAASGIVPSSLRIARALLSRVEDETTGRMKLPELFAPIPGDRMQQAIDTAAILGDTVWNELPFAGDTKPMGTEYRPGAHGEPPAVRPKNEINAARILEKTWMPQLAVTAIAGYPAPENGGNVLLPYTTLKLSLRLPPTAKADAARLALKRALETDPPYEADVTFEAPRGEGGWNAPALAPWLEASLNRASRTAFGAPVAFHGEGGSIPFMAMLGEKFPGTQFVVTGVLGPHSNAHGPNEFLHIATAKKVAACIAQVVADHAGSARRPEA